MAPQPEPPESFDVDAMLGKLAKWLRILGFDAEYPCEVPSQGRTFITARRRVRYSGAIVVTSKNCLEQLKSVLEEAGVQPDPELFLSRCLECNIPVQDASRESVLEEVPAAILAEPRQFSRCLKCGRVFWVGSHGARMKRQLLENGISLD
jgi:uncharacterized protein